VLVKELPICNFFCRETRKNWKAFCKSRPQQGAIKLQEVSMARGSKAKYTSKQKRQAHHIEESEKKSGKSGKRAAQIGWATVNKETKGAGKKVSDTSSSKKGGRIGGKSVAASKRSAAAKKAWQTRRHEGSAHSHASH
jgi:hypothetical protein